MIPSRRRFLFGAAATLVAAPAIVRVAANLMPISSRATDVDFLYDLWWKMTPGGREEWAFLEGMSQTFEATIWYGNGSRTPMEFTGFAALLSNPEGRIA